MSQDDFDDGLVHGHSWAVDREHRVAPVLVADAASAKTPSSVIHDDIHHAE